VAAPIFRQIADAALRYAGGVPTVAPDPPVRRARVGEVPQLPRAVSAASRATPVRVALSTDPGVMPDVRGLPMRDAVRELSRAGLAVRVNGSGFVASQTPAPGVPITGESWSVLRLRTDPDPVRPSSAPSGVPE